VNCHGLWYPIKCPNHGNCLVKNTWQLDVSNDARNIMIRYNGIIDVEMHYNNIEGSGS